MLDNDSPIILVCSEAVRSYQTASLIRSELIYSHGFKMVSVLDDRMPILNEIPRPSEGKPLPKDYRYDLHKWEIRKVIHGESFLQRMHSWSDVFSSIHDRLLYAVDRHRILKYPGCELKPLTNTQIVFVGHQYSVAALLGGLLKHRLVLSSELSAERETNLAEAAVRYPMEHDEFLYISHLIHSDTFETSARFFRLQKYSTDVLQRSIGNAADMKVNG